MLGPPGFEGPVVLAIRQITEPTLLDFRQIRIYFARLQMGSIHQTSSDRDLVRQTTA